MRDQIVQILDEYDIGQFVSITELSPGYANRSFKLVTGSGVFLFRWVLEKGFGDLLQELVLLRHLKDFQFPTAYPIAKCDGSYVSAYAPGHAVIYDYIQGEHPSLSSAVVSQIGESVGRLSVIPQAENFDRQNTINIQSSLELAEQLPMAPVRLPDIYDYFIRVSAELSERLVFDLPKGLIHADVFPDNTLFKDDSLMGIIDFEEACTDTLLFDLAMAINGFCFPDNSLSESHLTTLINSYIEKRMLTDLEWKVLPLYIAWTAHGMLSWHLARLSQNHLQKQEDRVRELMDRVVGILDREEELVQQIRSIR